MQQKKDVFSFILALHQEKGFFNSVENINKYNMEAIVELIQYTNIKEYGDPLYTKRELRSGIKDYFKNSIINDK